MTDPLTPPSPQEDNLFGICAALGEDFGFDPLWLRLALAFGLLFALEGVLLAYAALGLAVVVSRLLAPSPRSAATATATADPASPQVTDTAPPLDLAA